MIIKQCEFCDKEFEAKIWPTGKEKRYCSKSCSNLDRKPDIWTRLKTEYIENETCHEWTGSVDAHGYGLIGYNKKVHKVHRLIWELTYDTVLSSDVKILHSCDNPICFNILHLNIGSQKDNILDMARKDRHGRITVSKEKVLEIIERNKNGESRKDLAIEVGVVPGTIGKWVRGVNRNV